jgi:hypothetical protein
MVGEDFAVVCVDFAIGIDITQTVQTVAVDCQRMTWMGSAG